MRRTIGPWLLLAAATGCEEDVPSRIELALADEAVVWPLDINSDTPAEGIDDAISLIVTFGELADGLDRTLEWSEYQVEYAFPGDMAPRLTGELTVAQAEGETVELTIPAFRDPQRNWVLERYQGGELLVPFRVSLAGEFETLSVIVFEEFTAAFADYQEDAPDDPVTK